MKRSSIKDYLLNKLFFPKVVRIDKPGIIYNYVDRKFGGPRAKKRIVWYFEDFPVHLKLETIKRLGKEKTAELWYNIGRNVASGYLRSGNSKKIPKILFTSVVNYVLNSLRSGGVSLLKEVNFRNENLIHILGHDNIICRKTKDPSFFKGLVETLICSFSNKACKVDILCNNCPNCEAYIKLGATNKTLKTNSKKNTLNHYEKTNFSYDSRIIRNMENRTSFKDLLKFKKVHIDSKGKFIFNNEFIFPNEISSFTHFIQSYIDENQEQIFMDSLDESTKTIFSRILLKEENPNKRRIIVENILVSFGFGFPYFKKMGNFMEYKILFPPMTKWSDKFIVTILKSILETSFNKNISILDYSTNLNPSTLKAKFKIIS